ncbi:MAG: hypothetical protein J7L15_08325 [Clostridiales bacterium]|nr:hypothetical protein [Clostridiales bacterium]
MEYLRVEKHLDIFKLFEEQSGKHIANVFDKPDAEKLAVFPEMLKACEHVRDNLVEESEQLWEHEITHLNFVINKIEDIEDEELE